MTRQLFKKIKKVHRKFFHVLCFPSTCHLLILQMQACNSYCSPEPLVYIRRATGQCTRTSGLVVNMLKCLFISQCIFKANGCIGHKIHNLLNSEVNRCFCSSIFCHNTWYISILFSLPWTDSHPSESVVTRKCQDQRDELCCWQVTFRLLSQAGSNERKRKRACTGRGVFRGKKLFYLLWKNYIKLSHIHWATKSEHFQRQCL